MPWLNDRKWAYIRMEGRNFGDVPLNLELKLEVWDSPNSAGVIIDAVRCAKVALDRGIGGPLVGPSAYFMKSPPVQYHDDEAYRLVEAFAAGEDSPGLTSRTEQPGLGGPGLQPELAPTRLLRPPRVEAAAGLVLAERALVEAELHQEVEGLAHGRARGQAEVVHDLARRRARAGSRRAPPGRAAPRCGARARPCAVRGPGPAPRCGWCSPTG